MSNPSLFLSYWIRGQPLDRNDSIRVSPDTDVASLLKLIRLESIVLSQEELMSIYIYKIPDNRPVPVDDSEEELGKLSVSVLGKHLSGRRELSQIFPTQPSDSHLHLIIDPSSIAVTCWLRGTNIEESFVVSSSKQDKPHRLKRAIKKEHPDLKDIPEAKLKLYKTSCTDDELAEILDKNLEGQILDKGKTLKHFCDDVYFSEDLRIIVDWVDEKASKPPPSVHRFVEDEDPIAKKRSEYLMGVPRKAPSAFSKLSAFKQRQEGVEGQAVLCNRPRDCEDTIPATLLHPIFGQFVDDCQTIELEAGDNNFAQRLATDMSGLYKSEGDRRKVFNNMFSHYDINFQAVEIPDTKFTTDACLFVNDHRSVIVEIKNEAGISGEPYFQVVTYYLESTRENAPKYSGSTLPCLLLAVAGPNITFGGAVWNTRPSVQLLTMPIACNIDTRDFPNHVILARYMAALRQVIRALNEYYEDLPKPPLYQSPSHFSKTLPQSRILTRSKTSSQSNTPPQSGTLARSKASSQARTAPQSRVSSQSKSTPASKAPSQSNAALRSETTKPEQLFPGTTSYKRSRGEKTETIEFKYDGGVVEDKLVFFGTELHSGERICIKFCYTYSEKAHECMAKLGHAPALRAVNRIPGGWTMAVSDALLDFETIADRRQRLSAHVFDSISGVLSKFHEAGFVHGDVRDVNIMVSMTDEKKFMFVDFDWAGRKGVAQYPPCLNIVDIRRPDGALDGKLVLEEHDVFMLDQIIRDNL